MSKRQRRARASASYAAAVPAPAPVRDRRNLPGEARHLIANARNDIFVPYYSGALRPQDETLIARGGGKGLKIYDEIKRDGRAYAALEKRKMHLLAREWEVTAASAAALDVEAADVTREIFAGVAFDRLCEQLLEATLKGYAVVEVVWGRRDNRIVPVAFVPHDARRFVFDADGRLRLLTPTAMTDGIPVPDRKFIVHRFGDGADPYGLGLGTRLFWAVLFKREGIAFWMHFLDKFAGPTLVAGVPYGTLSEEQRLLMQALEEARTSSVLTVPIGVDVKFLEATRSGSVSYEGWLDYWDTEISITVTGETLTTDIGAVGSKAAADTHHEILELLVDSDGDLLSDTLRSSLIQWIVDYNVPGATPPSVYRVRRRNESAAADVRQRRAASALKESEALRAVMRIAALISDDAAARAYLVATGTVDELSDEVIDTLVGIRSEIAKLSGSGDQAPDQVPSPAPDALP